MQRRGFGRLNASRQDNETARAREIITAGSPLHCSGVPIRDSASLVNDLETAAPARVGRQVLTQSTPFEVGPQDVSTNPTFYRNATKRKEPPEDYFFLILFFCSARSAFELFCF